MIQISDNYITEIAAKIAASTTASRIILFGSYAEGTNREDSDIDLCVITDDPRRKLDILQELYRTVAYESDKPLDILVYSTEEFNERASMAITFEHKILTTGKEIPMIINRN